ncbi:MAG: mycofactocin radical SAM maturase [Thermodesulfobacteriota bacterium]
MLTRIAREGLSAPVNLTWEVTLGCNLRCRHCLSAAGEPRSDELSTLECRAVVDELAALKVFQVNIGGGEPFLREDLVDLLVYAHEKGLVTCVSTNGTLVDDGLAARLSRMKLLYLQVSLDGATAEVNDPIRGRGTYRRILDGVACLARRGVPFSLNTVLTRTNFFQLETLRALAAEYGAELRVSRFRPSGRGQESLAALGPDKDQLEAFCRWLETHDLVRTGDSFFALTSEKRRRLGLDMCGAAKMTCCLSPAGEVFPCAFLQEPEFLAGRLRETRLGEIWRRAPVFLEFRRLAVQSCEWCFRFESCRGGCPAVAYHTYRDLSQPDPECMQCLGRPVA